MDNHHFKQVNELYKMAMAPIAICDIARGYVIWRFPKNVGIKSSKWYQWSQMFTSFVYIPVENLALTWGSPMTESRRKPHGILPVMGSTDSKMNSSGDMHKLNCLSLALAFYGVPRGYQGVSSTDPKKSSQILNMLRDAGECTMIHWFTGLKSNKIRPFGENSPKHHSSDVAMRLSRDMHWTNKCGQNIFLCLLHPRLFIQNLSTAHAHRWCWSLAAVSCRSRAVHAQSHEGSLGIVDIRWCNVKICYQWLMFVGENPQKKAIIFPCL